MHAFDALTGRSRYLRWQHTWWSGVYSIVLTKVSYFHKSYLQDYFRLIPESFLEYVDKHRNCEDLAMAYVISVLSHLPPVWVGSANSIQETASSGISSNADHFVNR
jgi:hypothetical protein